MALKNFVVVEFLGEATVDVIHSKWLSETANKGIVTRMECYWPPGGNQEKLVKAGPVPDHSTWTLHEVRILYSTDDYLLARKRATEAQFTSNLDSDDEPERSVRKRKPVQFTSDDETIPKSKMVKRTTERPRTSQASAGTSRTSSSLPAAPRPPTPTFRGSHDSDDDLSLTSSPSLLRSPPSASCSSLNSFEGLAKQLLKDSFETKRMVKELQRQFTNMTAKMEIDDCNANVLPQDFHLPLQTVADVDALDSLDESKQETLVKSLSAIGGSNTKDLVKRMMRRMLTDHCASSFNWKGKNEKKKAFSRLTLLTIIKRAVRKNPGTSKAADCEIEGPIKEWLRYAPERAGGRKEREERKRAEQANQTPLDADVVETF